MPTAVTGSSGGMNLKIIMMAKPMMKWMFFEVPS